MAKFYYAEIDENNKCKAILETKIEFVDNSNMIEISEYDESRLGMIYNDGVWEEDPTPTPPSNFDLALQIVSQIDITELEKTDEGIALKALLKLNGLI